MLQKLYAGSQDGRYSPAECIGTRKVEVTGSPGPKHVSTSYVEAEPENENEHAPLHLAHECLFTEDREPRRDGRALLHVVQLRQDSPELRVTPAMEAGIADHVWSLDEIVGLVA